jgi:hypothetical protein
MKTTIKVILMAFLMSNLQSCSTGESNTLNEDENPLKSYTLSRDSNGSYSLEQHLNSGVTSTIVPNERGNVIIFSQGEDAAFTKNKITSMENNDVKIEFLTENHIQIPGITIINENALTTLNKTNEDIKYIKSYKIKMSEDGSYLLHCTLENGYYPTYEYNKEKERHQIRLNPGEIKENQTSFSKKYTKFEGEKLNIIFVRKAFVNTSSKMNRRQMDFPEPPEFYIID